MTGSRTETAKLEALIVDKLFADLRDRRFLKWLFKTEESVIGDFPGLRSLDLDVQQEIRDKWEAIISRVLSIYRPAVKDWKLEDALDPFIRIARHIEAHPAQYQGTLMRSGGLSNAADLRALDFTRLLSALSSLSPPASDGEPLTFGYTNWRGEYAERTAIPLRIERKESEWHGPGLHYVMVAFDVEKQAERDFLLTDMGRAAATEKGADGNTPS